MFAIQFHPKTTTHALITATEQCGHEMLENKNIKLKSIT